MVTVVTYRNLFCRASNLHEFVIGYIILLISVFFDSWWFYMFHNYDRYSNCKSYQKGFFCEANGNSFLSH